MSIIKFGFGRFELRFLHYGQLSLQVMVDVFVGFRVNGMELGPVRNHTSRRVRMRFGPTSLDLFAAIETFLLRTFILFRRCQVLSRRGSLL